MPAVQISACTATSALGVGRQALLAGLRAERSALRVNDFGPPHAPLGAGWIGRVDQLEAVRLPQALARYQCRNHQLAWQGLHADDFTEQVFAAREKYGAERIAVLMGSSTSGILSTEQAYRERGAGGDLPNWFSYAHVHNYGALPMFVRDALQLRGPIQSISTACSSSAKVFAAAARWLALGWCDAAVVGGVDSLCGTTIHGFSALQLVADRPCRPFDSARNGISIGEAAGFALLERANGDRRPSLLGYGESADASHMSAPHPQGLGATTSMQAALRRAGVSAAQIDYVCAHGTATRLNDQIEAQAVRGLLGESARITSNKGYAGHTLGAAGALSVVISVLSLEQGFIPATVNCADPDPTCPADVVLSARSQPVNHVLINAFGFGGNNCSLLIGRG